MRLNLYVPTDAVCCRDVNIEYVVLRAVKYDRRGKKKLRAVCAVFSCAFLLQDSEFSGFGLRACGLRVLVVVFSGKSQGTDPAQVFEHVEG